VFENRALRRIFGSKREELAGGWSRPHNEELHNLYASSIRVFEYRRMRWAEYIPCLGEMRNTEVLVGKPDLKRPPGRSSRRWEDNIRLDIREIWWADVDWINLSREWDQ
jgi:hypothetical protein